ncbi:MAG: glycosyltransferase family 2 protein [Acidaminococcaceae bacterium]
MQKLAVIILTKNEEKNITDVINNAKQCSDEIIIIDSGSTDNTVMLAEQAGAKVFFRAWDNDFAAQRNFGLTLTNAEWVLYLDADERLDHQLVSAINKVKESNKLDAQYTIRRISSAFGQQFKHGVLRPDRVARLFPRGKVLWVNRVHERPESDLPKFRLNGNIIHYTYSGWTQWLRKFEQYTTIWANDAYKKGKRTSPFGIVSHANFAFIQMAFLRLGLLDGFMGFVMCCNHFFYTMIKYLKLYELQRGEDK